MVPSSARTLTLASQPTRSPRQQPFRQGHFDGLCALYSIVNAFRRCLGDHPLYDQIWPELFSFLVEGLASEVDFAAIVLDGVPAKAMPVVLSNAAGFLKDQYAIDLTIERPIDSRDQLNIKDVLQRLAALAEQPQTALLAWLRLDGPIRHWTVIERVGPRRLRLLDSAGYRGLKTKELRLAYELEGRSAEGQSSVVLKPPRIFLIRRAG